MPQQVPSPWEIFGNIPLEYVALAFVTVLARYGIPPLARRLGWRKPGQRRRERKARRIIEKLPSMQGFPQRISYLRKIDPFVFEELVLESFKRRGCRIRRNSRYTGDGGIDGRVWINGHLYLIQAKRYRKHINPQHVRDFCQMVEANGCRGIFVHTGRTGNDSRAAADATDHVSIVSGERLDSLLLPQDNHSAPPGR